jgi:hypothetical protein
MAGGMRLQQEAPMSRRYDSFLIRYWALDENDNQRVEVTHIRSGARALVTSWDYAVGWMRGQATAEPDDGRDGATLGWSGRDEERP